jgi:uncharacterized protein (TIGR04255 family)
MRAPVKFTRPPVIEVACGVLFSAAQPLVTGHVGAFWESVRSEFPRLQDAPPLANVVEGSGAFPEIAIDFLNLPPLRRTWMLNTSGCNLIQLQQDRFLFNWKKAAEQESYPNFSVVYSEFERHLSHFLDFCQKSGVGPVAMRQFELAYVNHISKADMGTDVSPGSVLVDHVPAKQDGRFLPEPEGFNWTTGYQLPEGLGRLHIIAQTAINLPSQEKLIRLDLTARGIGSDTSAVGRRHWFDVAHDWITHGFADVTSPRLHDSRAWGRTS